MEKFLNEVVSSDRACFVLKDVFTVVFIIRLASGNKKMKRKLINAESLFLKRAEELSTI